MVWQRNVGPVAKLKHDHLIEDVKPIERRPRPRHPSDRRGLPDSVTVELYLGGNRIAAHDGRWRPSEQARNDEARNDEQEQREIDLVEGAFEESVGHDQRQAINGGADQEPSDRIEGLAGDRALNHAKRIRVLLCARCECKLLVHSRCLAALS